ncbi:MAG: hypothetical protein IPK66_07350 [Rhodospirillales bacterium]|nr:hypothetical protein [Rhodospirillales bacterium]
MSFPSRGEQRRLGPERPQLARCKLAFGVLGVVAGKRQMLPPERRDVPHHFRPDAEFAGGELKIVTDLSAANFDFIS